ncbi:acyltransferase [Arthrobacter sunyaminii]|uniref:Acyltransferase n=1 Tax=Arthrobacter sunyaminii TaxID=2816859 RepID=A0A975PCK3_9MICC|nr:acyltransferase [Arthrobacter sunyaminii]MBO0896019.1 acyltransferase [Arthrobacter sunyaminii]MBO0907694.1 acyltransferase [Arthrobacter sunyaminii]QWQ35250.1 acyltransferase [Arthrobacter sunyaminii]
MVVLNVLSAYEDENSNRINYQGPDIPGIRIEFTGTGNTLSVAEGVRIAKLTIVFDCDNGTVSMGNSKFGHFSGWIRVGQDSEVRLGENVTTTNTCVISAVEGTSVMVGDDVMFASENELRADDGHAIFDVHSEKRVNHSEDIIVGSHVWLAKRAVLLGGAKIGNGSVIGFGSIVSGVIPNNCVAAGIPARVIRRDVAWERPHLSLSRPYYKPDASSITKSAYWATTAVEEPETRYAVVSELGGAPAVIAFETETEARAWANDNVSDSRTFPLLKRAEADKLLTAEKAPKV